MRKSSKSERFAIGAIAAAQECAVDMADRREDACENGNGATSMTIGLANRCSKCALCAPLRQKRQGEKDEQIAALEMKVMQLMKQVRQAEADLISASSVGNGRELARDLSAGKTV
jgi:hypothetical protein